MPPTPDENRILTIPNILSFVRLLGVPLFLWLILGPQADVAAFVVLAVAGATDWFDGYLARRLNQRSRLGVLLDPLADRLYIAATLLGLALREIIPWWLVAVLVTRELFILAMLPILRSRGMVALPVTYVGKSATFALLWGFPLLLLGDLPSSLGDIAATLGWACAIWGTYMYWWSAIRYWQQALALRSTT